MQMIFYAALAASGYILVLGILCFEAGRSAKRREEVASAIAAVPTPEPQGFEDLNIPDFLRRAPAAAAAS